MLKVSAYGRIVTDITLEQKDEILYTNFLFASHERSNTTFIRCVAFGPLQNYYHNTAEKATGWC